VSVRRIPYASLEHMHSDELVTSIGARRGGRLLNLDRMLLHSPPLARGWNAHLEAVRSRLVVDPGLRELAICAVAVLNAAEYELEQHAPQWLREGGTTQQQQALRSSYEAAMKNEALFNAAERVVLRLTLEMTRRVQVSDKTLAQVRSTLGRDRLVVELVGIIATYNMVSRFLVALDIEQENLRAN
jgi:alkylhydroperoxidase family enzyme